MPSELDPQTLLRHKPNVLSSPLDQDLVLMSIDTDRYFGMDGLSRRVWELFAQPRSIAEACSQLRAEYDVSPEQCAHDVIAFVGHLMDAQLVEIVAP